MTLNFNFTHYVFISEAHHSQDYYNELWYILWDGPRPFDILISKWHRQLHFNSEVPNILQLVFESEGWPEVQQGIEMGG